jgi:hypothetical protein
MQHEHLQSFLSAAFGTSYKLMSFQRLAGGTRKGVYRLKLVDGGSVILYTLSASESYWFDPDVDPGDPFAEVYGIEFMETAAVALANAGARSPKIYLTDRSRSLYPGDIALVEDIPNGTLEAYVAANTTVASSKILPELGGMLTGMSKHSSPKLGKLFSIASGLYPQGQTAGQIIFDRAIRHLHILAEKLGVIKNIFPRIEAKLNAGYSDIKPRAYYSLVHGELGPDHILLDGNQRPVIIDIEGLMFFDVEWEHAFLKMRFAEMYDALEMQIELDPVRMAFYELAQSISLVEGPLRILDTDFPDKAFMQRIIAIHTDNIIRLSS